MDHGNDYCRYGQARPRGVKDPELGLNIVDIGLVYDVAVSDAGDAHIQMTLTSPGCPVAGTLPRDVEYKVARLPEVFKAKVDLLL